MLKIAKFGTIFFFWKKLKMYLLLEFIWYPNEILTQETYGKSKKNVRARILIFVIFEILGGFLGPNFTKISVFDPPGGQKIEKLKFRPEEIFCIGYKYFMLKFHKDAT